MAAGGIHDQVGGGFHLFAAVTHDILDYVGREMAAPDGGFYSATDADSQGVEGKFFVWTPAEIRAALDAPHADAVLAYYGVTGAGNFHGTNILHVVAPLPEVAKELALEPIRLRQDARGFEADGPARAELPARGAWRVAASPRPSMGTAVAIVSLRPCRPLERHQSRSPHRLRTCSGRDTAP
jgi:hypothetical protein